MPTYYQKPNFNSCVLCLKSTKKGYDISLHKFPKNPARRAVWLKNCGFVEEDVQHNRKLCSSHFEENGIILTGIRRVLKKSAVPVIFKETIKRKRNKKRSKYSKNSETGTRSNSKVYFIPALMLNFVKPIVQNSIPTTILILNSLNTLNTRTIKTTTQKKVEEPENPAADVIPMAVLCQFTAKLSEYSLDPEKNYGTNNVPIIPMNH
ncbi:52 kDa repressor of the inhibitor of the protein kinase-like [Rhopalosiphum padi]|uniref:52 kDa repressor of the inhibitor of the protein kinase-like n=1 Tax=Rhopalosiphum padi TaxID=40932 RepID=UPI00298E7961|nr:52 kDa repressor of the inhibitor of the protein kinase-like [Rhopalosiphum padi]